MILDVAIGYVLGNLICYVAGALWGAAVKTWLVHSPYWQRQVRRSLRRDRATLVGPWVTRR